VEKFKNRSKLLTRVQLNTVVAVTRAGWQSLAGLEQKSCGECAVKVE